MPTIEAFRRTELRDGLPARIACATAIGDGDLIDHVMSSVEKPLAIC